MAGVLEHYRLNDIVPGDPNEGEWENAHDPAPRWAGGTETTPLLKQHHAVQGVLQGAEYGKMSCHKGNTLKTLKEHWPNGLPPELDGLYELLEGTPGPNTGNRHSDETKSRMSKAALGREKSPETCQKLSEAGRTTVVCPHCEMQGAKGRMVQFHFDRCPKKEGSWRWFKEQMKELSPHWSADKNGHWNRLAGKSPDVKCPHCGAEGRPSGIKPWHFDNCDQREGSWRWFKRELKEWAQ